MRPCSYYEDGAFGIRIENLFAVVEANTEFRCGLSCFGDVPNLLVCFILLHGLRCTCFLVLFAVVEANTEFRCGCLFW